jgi:hypothetical protein
LCLGGYCQGRQKQNKALAPYTHLLHPIRLKKEGWIMLQFRHDWEKGGKKNALGFDVPLD